MQGCYDYIETFKRVMDSLRFRRITKRSHSGIFGGCGVESSDAAFSACCPESAVINGQPAAGGLREFGRNSSYWLQYDQPGNVLRHACNFNFFGAITS